MKRKREKIREDMERKVGWRGFSTDEKKERKQSMKGYFCIITSTIESIDHEFSG